jgi:CDP-glucose 4,6-dehydratase
MGRRQGTVEALGVSAPLPQAAFWRNKRVLLTGHTGFKGAWAALWLNRLGAKLTGFALPPDTKPALFAEARVDTDLVSVLGDLRDGGAVERVVQQADPEIALLFAAQPIVRRALANPLETIDTNVMGAANVLESLRGARNLRVIVLVTSDKVYANSGQKHAFAETDPLGGKDPYSASKAAAEIIARAFAACYFAGTGRALVTARGGNVIGGGDFAPDRIVPDIVRAAAAGRRPLLRLPGATRPWQHVLDSLCGYLLYAEALASGGRLPPSLNFGPADGPSSSVGSLAQSLLAALGRDPSYDLEPDAGSFEMPSLSIDSRLARKVLGWHDQLSGAAMIEWTAAWYRETAAGADPRIISLAQIEAYEALSR